MKAFVCRWILTVTSVFAVGYCRASAVAAADLPAERCRSAPNPVFDRHVIDNQWAIKYKRTARTRLPVKHP
jgi:hypothetical protein